MGILNIIVNLLINMFNELGPPPRVWWLMLSVLLTRLLVMY